MVDFTGVAAVSTSLQRYLRFRFDEEPPVPGSQTRVVLARTEDLNADEDPLISAPALSLFLYRVSPNKATRATWADQGQTLGRALLPLDCHYLFIPWGENAEDEQRILGRTLQAMEDTPILAGPFLDPVTPWRDGETVQVCLQEFSTEDIMRTFDSLPINYKLCVPYLARVLILEGRRTAPSPETSTATLRDRAEVAP